jgi:hypothetical protein
VSKVLNGQEKALARYSDTQYRQEGISQGALHGEATF